MLLSRIQKTLQENINKLNVKTEGVQGSHNLKFTNYRAAIDATKNIKQTGILQQNAKQILNSEIALSVEKSIIVSQNTGKAFQQSLSRLKTNAETILSFLDEFLEKPTENSILVKLPETNDIKKVSKILLDLNKALEQSLLIEELEAKIELVEFQKGSKWMVIALGSMFAFNFLAQMVRLIYEIRSKEIEIESKRQVIRTLRIQNEARQSALEAFQEEIINNFEKEIKNEYSEGLDNIIKSAGVSEVSSEYRSRLKLSIEILKDLIFSGLEIQPALLNNENNDHDGFPDPKQLMNILDKLPEKTTD